MKPSISNLLSKGVKTLLVLSFVFSLYSNSASASTNDYQTPKSEKDKPKP